MNTKKDITYLNTNQPRESIVINDTEGDGVIKTPTATRPEYIATWLEKQRHARMTVNFILKSQNRLGGYFIPQITNIEDSIESPRVHEQRAKGRALTKEYFDSLPPDTQEKIYKSLANFVYDMNHCRPILSTQQKLANQSKSGLTFEDILNKISPYLDKKEILSVRNAYDFFLSHPEMTSALVFFHGDMNENNMFYDAATDTVSFLDFAESTYETLEYIFNHDLIKLPWLDSEKLIKYYSELSKKDNICIKSNPTMLKLYDALNNLKWTGESVLSSSGNVDILKKILQENIKKITSAYGTVIISMQQNSHNL